jgi:hypothetical protein
MKLQNDFQRQLHLLATTAHGEAASYVLYLTEHNSNE